MEKNRNDIRRITNAMFSIDGAYGIISKKFGVKANLMWLLYALDDGEFHSQRQICDDWTFPKTTINTLIKQCEADGYIILKTISGHKRELQICLTDAGKEYAYQILDFIYKAEEEALEETLKKYSTDFIFALESFSDNLKTAFEKHIQSGKD